MKGEVLLLQTSSFSAGISKSLISVLLEELESRYFGWDYQGEFRCLTATFGGKVQHVGVTGIHLAPAQLPPNCVSA